MPDAPLTAAQFREAQGEEYGEFVAAHTIFIDGARAFNEGDPVPKSHVSNGVVAADSVHKITTKAGREAAAAAVAPADANPKG